MNENPARYPPRDRPPALEALDDLIVVPAGVKTPDAFARADEAKRALAGLRLMFAADRECPACGRVPSEGCRC